ncbi:hypothetical protein AGLY_011983 [Aphis glycines]|uniref:Integrase catalytic domain-containing protein n=1 Tax=Aphis glycines TaxID=307491 RepID=A0A6G0TCN5_APHGL|nr:hypothetical protein AGLY_011983 [Aphis glycines]
MKSKPNKDTAFLGDSFIKQHSLVPKVFIFLISYSKAEYFFEYFDTLFPSGGELSMKLQKKKPIADELVDRLRLLLVSRTAALKSKTGKEFTNAMSKILRDRSPKLLQLDNRKEFHNATFDALMSKYSILKYSTFSIMKACIVERFNRTLKEKMFRELTARGSHEWISILPLLLNEYNNSKHKTIGMSPVQADADPTLVKLKQRKINNKKIKFKVGDNVRISTHKGVFKKVMNVFGGSQSGDTKKIILNLEESFESHTSKLEKFEQMTIVNTETWASQHWIFKNSNFKQDNKSRKTN